VATTADVWLSLMVRLAMGRKNDKEKAFCVCLFIVCVGLKSWFWWKKKLLDLSKDNSSRRGQ